MAHRKACHRAAEDGNNGLTAKLALCVHHYRVCERLWTRLDVRLP